MLGAVAPPLAERFVASRLRVRKMREVLAKYDGASKSSRTSGWETGRQTGPNAEINGALSTLRARARDLTRNTWFGIRAAEVKTTGVIRTGIRPSIAGQNPELEARLKSWRRSTDVDIDGLHNFGGLQALAYRTKFESGGAFVRRFVEDRELKLQVFEPDWVDHTYSQRLEGDRFVIQGVEFDARGRRVGYHFLKNHPGSSTHYRIKDEDREFVPASEVVHLFDVLRPGQVRGIPETTPVLIGVKDWDDYEDAQLMRQKIAACFTAFVSADAGPRAGLPGTDSNDETLDGEPIGRVQPGMIMKMQPGEEITFGSPPDVEGYRDFASIKLHHLSAGIQVPYEELTGDYSEVNYSSARMGRLTYDAHIDKQQQLLVIPRFLDRVADWWLQLERVRGTADENDRWEFTPPRREMIDPAKETDAQIRSIRAGLSTRQDEIRKRGREPEQVYEEIRQDNQVADENEFVFDTDPRKQNSNGTPRRDTSQDGQNED